MCEGAAKGSQLLFISDAKRQHEQEESNLVVTVPLKHDRSGHAEIMAICEVLRAVAACGVDLSCAVSRSSAGGEVHLYVSHHPCLSCIGALSQLQAALPGASVRVSFDWHPEAGLPR